MSAPSPPPPAAPLPPPTPDQPRAPGEKKPFWRRTWVLITGGLIVLIVIISLATNGGSKDKNKGSSAAAQPSAKLSAAASQAASKVASKTSSAVSKASSAAAAAAASRKVFDERYGTFPAVRKSASGDGVVALPSGAKAAVVTATTSGSGNFVVAAIDAKNQPVDLLVNVIGSYRGATAYGLGGTQPARLKVTADGPWTVKVAPISTAPMVHLAATGRTDGVYLWNGKASDWAMRHKGEGNFVVTQYTGGLVGVNLLVNEIGKYSGTVPADEGPAVATIQADGVWTLKVT